MDSSIKWLNANTVRDDDAVVEKKTLWDKYTEYCSVKKQDQATRSVFCRALTRYHPYVKDMTKRSKEAPRKNVQLYKNIGFKKAPSVIPRVLTVIEIRSLLSQHGTVLSSGENYLDLGVVTDIVCNGSTVLKEVHINFDSYKWSLKLRGKNVDLKRLEISDTFGNSFDEVTYWMFIIKELRVCVGKPYTESELSNYCVKERYYVKGDENSECPIIRSIYCTEVLGLKQTSYTCKICTYRKFKDQVHGHSCDNELLHNESVYDVELDEEDHKDMEEILKNVIGDADYNVKEMLMEQVKAINCSDPRGRRWSTLVISVCLALWVKSRRAYETLQNSKLLVLPSTSTLQRHKNKAPSSSGFHERHLKWMRQCATEAGIPPHGMHGGIIHDETKIQEDLVTKSVGGKTKIIGWVDMGMESLYLDVLKNKTFKRPLATEALQFMFLGYTGFRFPIAHFASCCAKASEITINLWNAVSELASWGFTVDFVLQDGGEQNRQSMKQHFPAGCMIESNFLTANLTDLSRKIAIGQDFSHVLKKIRNACYSSGYNTSEESKRKYPRRLQKDGKQIVWEQWVNAVKWDREENSRPIHYKISDSHLFPSSSEKMRNHLAEDVMNSDMLHLFQCFRAHIKTDEVDSTIELLEQTSVLCDIFRDKRPVQSAHDERLRKLDGVLNWFIMWENEIQNLDNTKYSLSEKNKKLPSWESREDLKSLIITFREVVKMHTADFPGSGVVPSRYNSDLVENHFSQQRGVCNGNLTNPNYSTYCDSSNSIILTQSVRSLGRKSNAGVQAASEYKIPLPHKKPSCHNNEKTHQTPIRM